MAEFFNSLNEFEFFDSWDGVIDVQNSKVGVWVMLRACFWDWN